jgi:ubiquitin-like protein Pup
MTAPPLPSCSTGSAGDVGCIERRWIEEDKMAERTQKQRTTSDRTDEVVDHAAPVTSESGEKLKAELDDLLDEIDEVLESNAEDFVKSYVQKGGQ